MAEPQFRHRSSDSKSQSNVTLIPGYQSQESPVPCFGYLVKFPNLSEPLCPRVLWVTVLLPCCGSNYVSKLAEVRGVAFSQHWSGFPLVAGALVPRNSAQLHEAAFSDESK